MEKKDNKRIIIGVLVAVILILAGLCIYLLLISKDNEVVENISNNQEIASNSNSINDCPKCQECEKCENKSGNECPVCENNVSSDIAKTFYENMVKNRKVSTEYDYGIKIVMDKNGNVYYSGVIDDGAVGTKGKYEIEGYIAGIYDNPRESRTLEGYKLPISNVVNYFYSPKGNGGTLDYIFIKADGTIAKLSYFQSYSDGKARIVSFTETVSGYKNIVGIIPANDFGAHDYKLFDIYGNVYN